MPQRKVLITGISGQDGGLLAQYLINKNYKIIAPTRNNPDLSKLEFLGIHQHKSIEFVVYQSWQDVNALIKKYQPEKLFHLAAASHVGMSHENPDVVFDVNTQWTIQILKTIAAFSPLTKLFFASSCEIYQSDLPNPVKENDAKNPTNPYGISKLAAHNMVQYYRDVKDLFACNGILFNHESIVRDAAFVSKKICKEVARIVKSGGKPLSLGNIDAKKDWGYAPDYVCQFDDILNLKKAGDFNISTGVLHSVRDMVDASFAALAYQIKWQGEGLDCVALNQNNEVVVNINEKYFRPLDNRFLVGDNTKTLSELKQQNLTEFTSWVKIMTMHEYGNLK